MRKVLADLGHEATEFHSGEALLSALRDGGSFEAIFLDITMPGKSGIETLIDVKKLYRSIPVIMVTADVQKFTIDSTLSLGAAAAVAKPVKEESIRNVIISLGIPDKVDG